jgi:hypothetical protein
MKKPFIVVLMFALFIAPAILDAAGDRKVLVYYFKNLTGEDAYNGLVYEIPRYLYSRLKEVNGGYSPVVVDEGGIELSKKEPSVDLWASSSLMDLAHRQGIDEVLYGSFYVFNEKPVLVGKVLYPRSGLIMEVTEKTPAYFDLLNEASKGGVAGLARDGEGKQDKEYSPPFARTFGTPGSSKKTALMTSVGPLFPLGEWGELFPSGILGETSFVYFPKINTFPLGLGVNADYAFLTRGSGVFVDSKITALSLGAALQYKLALKKIRKAIVFDLNTGMNYTMLEMNSEFLTSFDPYFKAGASFITQSKKRFDFSLKGGFFTINYRDVPMDSLYVQAGIWANTTRRTDKSTKGSP